MKPTGKKTAQYKNQFITNFFTTHAAIATTLQISVSAGSGGEVGVMADELKNKQTQKRRRHEVEQSEDKFSDTDPDEHDKKGDKQSAPHRVKTQKRRRHEVELSEQESDVDEIHDKDHKKSMKKFSKRMQKFKKSWCTKYTWAKSSPLEDFYCVCSLCSCTLKFGTTGISALKRHEMRASHIENQKAVQKTAPNLFQMMEKEKHLENATSTLELQTALFIVTKNLPFNIADDFIDFLKTININPQIQGKLRCHRIKCKALICNVIGEHAKRTLVEKLRSENFSIMIDEATDLTSTKHLAICVRHKGSKPFTTVDEFLGLFEVTDATHKGLFNLIRSFFVQEKIPFESNLIGFASDGANVMMGAHHSVSTELKKCVPRLFLMKCICHSLDLAISKATKKLPSYLEDLLVDIHFYLKYSPKRVNAVGELQRLLNVPEHKILQLHKVRWLSLSSVVNRTLEQYQVLLTYFQNEKSPANEKATQIYERLKNPYTRIYFEFLSTVLRMVCKRNAEYQSEEPKVYLLHDQMTSFFKTIVSMYLKEDYVENTDVEFMDFREKTIANAHNWEHLSKVDIGAVAKADLYALNAPLKDQEAFRYTCRNFLVELANQIYIRFPFDHESVKFLENVKFVNPSNLKDVRDVSIAASFFNFDLEESDREWKSLRRRFKDNFEPDVTLFWNKVASLTYSDGSLEYPILVEMVERILLLPHSSAAVERLFSQITLQKTKVRNRLSTESLKAILYAKSEVKEKSNVFEVQYKDMFPLISKQMYE